MATSALDDDQGVVRVQPAHRVRDRMRVHVGRETHFTPRAAVAQGARDQARAPVAATYAQMQHAAIASGRIGLTHEFAHPLTLGQDGLGHPGGWLGRAQGGVPGGALLCPVGVAAVEQASPGCLEALLCQQRGLCIFQLRRIRLRAQVQA
jgi:hypothetical protein